MNSTSPTSFEAVLQQGKQISAALPDAGGVRKAVSTPTGDSVTISAEGREVSHSRRDATNMLTSLAIEKYSIEKPINLKLLYEDFAFCHFENDTEATDSSLKEKTREASRYTQQGMPEYARYGRAEHASTLCCI